MFSETGTWKVRHNVPKRWSGVGRNELEIHVSSGVFFFKFSREGDKLVFWEYFGDPDIRQYIEYERRDG